MCVMSLHKTLPSLTQTAVLNVYSNRVDMASVKHGLSIFETSSPSYILLASIDECLRYTLKTHKDFELMYENLDDFYKETKLLKNIKVFCFDDMGKIVISANDGQALAKKLREEKIEVEMVSENYVLAMATVADTKETLKALSSALFKIDKDIKPANLCKTKPFVLPKKSTDVEKALNLGGYQGSPRHHRPGSRRGKGKGRGYPRCPQGSCFQGRGRRDQGQARSCWRKGRNQVSYPLLFKKEASLMRCFFFVSGNTGARLAERSRPFPTLRPPVRRGM